MPVASVAGGDIHYATAGTGAPVAMLLPQSSGPLGPEAFIARIAESFTVIRYDQRGTGQSAPASASGGFTMTARAEEVAGLLDALGIGRSHLCCHSTGCGIGLAVAAAHPDRVAGLVLLSPWTHADGHLTVMQNLRVAAARGLGPVDYARFNASLLFPPAFRREHEAEFAAIAMAATGTPQDADVIASRLNAILAFDARPLLPSLRRPALVVSAADDQLMPAWFGREMADALPDARYVELSGGGHMLPETQGRALGETVADFLAGLGDVN